MPTAQPLISIIIPVYNSELYLDRVITSILQQTYTNWELLLVDDGSIDKSGMICHHYQQNDQRIFYFYTPNGGAGAARNFALDRFKGEYVTFVDSDDWVTPEYLEVLYSYLQKGNYDFSQALCYFDYENGNSEKQGSLLASKMLLNKEQMIHSALAESWEEITLTVCLKLFKASMFSNVRFPLNEQHEDAYAIFNIITKKACNCIIINHYLYHYYQRSNSRSKESSFKNYYDEASFYFYALTATQHDFTHCVEAATHLYLQRMSGLITHYWTFFLNDSTKLKEVQRRIKSIPWKYIQTHYKKKQQLKFFLIRNNIFLFKLYMQLLQKLCINKKTSLI